MSDSDGPKEARVEVLRAEVRVLMVGSRQVTLSVARQLDAVEPRQIKPFGRVRIDKDPTDQAIQRIEVVGSADGGLARSATSRQLFRCSRKHMGSEQQCAEYKRLRQADDAERQAQEARARQAGVTPPTPLPGSLPNSSSASRALYEHAEHDWWGYTDGEALYKAWEKLPLIVLAGLK
jgi:hypothetical protein